MKKILILILGIGLLLSCSNNNNIKDSEIVGEWKLIELQIPFVGGSTDYSNENIVYNFQSNGILKVNGGLNVKHSDGEYNYFFGEDYLVGTTGQKSILVKINETKWSYKLSNEKMRIGQSYLDGADLIFERK